MICACSSVLGKSHDNRFSQRLLWIQHLSEQQPQQTNHGGVPGSVPTAHAQWRHSLSRGRRGAPYLPDPSAATEGANMLTMCLTMEIYHRYVPLIYYFLFFRSPFPIPQSPALLPLGSLLVCSTFYFSDIMILWSSWWFCIPLPLIKCQDLFAAADGWLLLDSGWFVLLYILYLYLR